MMLKLSTLLNKPVVSDAYDRIELIRKGTLPEKLNELAVDGNDILDNNIAKGTNIGAVLRHLFLCVHNGTPNDTEALLTEAVAFAKKLP